MVPGGLSEEEKASVRYHLGYPMLDAVSTFAIGIPAAFETAFILEGALNRVRGHTLTRVQKLLCRLESAEDQMDGDSELLAISGIDEISIDPEMMGKLDGRYQLWQKALGNVLSVPVNPFDQRRKGLNISVRNCG